LSDNHQLRNRILGTVIGGIVLTLVLWLAGFIPTLWQTCKSAFMWLIGFLLSSISIPAWLIVVVSPFIVATLFRIFVTISRKDIKHPTWRDYKEDEIMGMIWRWHYSHYSGAIHNICCFCPYDDTELVYIERLMQVTLRCETCNRQFGPFNADHDHICRMAERQIRRKIRSGEWKAVLEQLKLQ
jgi:hypothetical protein